MSRPPVNVISAAQCRDNRGVTQEKLAAEAEARLKAEEEAEEQRKADSKVLAGETIRRELLERALLGLDPEQANM